MRRILAVDRWRIANTVASLMNTACKRLLPAAEAAVQGTDVSKWTAIKFYYQLLDNQRRGVGDPLAPTSAFVQGSWRANELRRSNYHRRFQGDPEYAERLRKSWRDQAARTRTRHNVNARSRDVRIMLRRMVNRARSKTRRSYGPAKRMTLDTPSLTAIWEEQGGRCPVSGLAMDHAAPARHPLVPSLDRVDPSKGYTPENVRLVCYFINLMKRDFPDDEICGILRVASSFAAGGPAEQGAPLPPTLAAPKLVTCLRNARARSARNQWPCDITLQTLHDMYQEQGGRCALSGILMSPESLTSRSISLDRIDSSKPYTRENLHMVCLCMNIAKLDQPIALFREVLAASAAAQRAP